MPGGAQKIPGRVERGYYDRGGEGMAYYDTDAKNNGSRGLNPADGTYWLRPGMWLRKMKSAAAAVIFRKTICGCTLGWGRTNPSTK
jgi:hypothetical protein